jgi:hypothetical protein
VFQSRADILEWNVKVPHYVDFVFIFVNKFLSQSGAIFLFHSNDLQLFKQIKIFWKLFHVNSNKMGGHQHSFVM